MIVLPEEWKRKWQGSDLWERVFALDGEMFRDKDGRRTFRFEKDGKGYFAKIHRGIGYRRLLKELFRLRLPVIGAENEWLAIQKLQSLGIRTMTLVGYGKQGLNPSKQHSFVITEELARTESLEDFCRDWPASPPDYALKKALIEEVAKITRALHENGMNHRDLYICHFLLDISGGRERIDPSAVRLHLIDLHRVQMRKEVPERWKVKDIAALFFSSMEIGLSQRDLLRFIRAYTGVSPKTALRENRAFWKKVQDRGDAFYREYLRKGDR